jgi:hypothetical protein
MAITKAQLQILGATHGVWLGVSARDLNDRSHAAYWCVPRDAKSGALLVLYRTRVGIVRLERIVSEPREGGECSYYGLLIAETELVVNLRRPITSRDIKADADLRQLPASRKNFQGTTFAVPPSLWSTLSSAIAERV